jgi:hypothetical protein
MKLLLATMFKKVPVRTTKQRATICKRCGTRIYSLGFLKKISKLTTIEAIRAHISDRCVRSRGDKVGEQISLALASRSIKSRT